jgi:hypothetical protein
LKENLFGRVFMNARVPGRAVLALGGIECRHPFAFSRLNRTRGASIPLILLAFYCEPLPWHLPAKQQRN